MLVAVVDAELYLERLACRVGHPVDERDTTAAGCAMSVDGSDEVDLILVKLRGQRNRAVHNHEKRVNLRQFENLFAFLDHLAFLTKALRDVTGKRRSELVFGKDEAFPFIAAFRLRMLEGGKYNVNIRRITNAETALVHPTTIDLWVVLEGSGTLTTGGTIQNGKIVGGQSHRIKAGDVEFIPATVPHGVSNVQGSITWLNIRWDNDWK